MGDKNRETERFSSQENVRKILVKKYLRKMTNFEKKVLTFLWKHDNITFAVRLARVV